MKELTNHHPDTIRIENQRQIEQQNKLETLVPYPGQKLWELNPATGTITEVTFTTTEIGYQEKELHHRVNINPHFDYVLAINKTNAQKKFLKARK